MDSAKAQLADKLKSANNILVTVSRDPSVDQLAACIGLTLLLNKLGKHAAAVFSGVVPSTIEFLKPDDTIEKNTDSLRDFIIALDKSKADKLRYKVEDNIVRIFITPYKTSINQDDLEFSQGDFNVDVVVALGVQRQEDLDEAITSHGRILHDATVASLNVAAQTGVGSIVWNDAQASSLSELVTDLAQAMGPNLLDNQIATALLTGIVAETERFRNDKTSPLTMSASAALMSAGANQQLVADQLEAPQPEPAADNPFAIEETPKEQDGVGTLEIEHEASHDEEPAEQPAPLAEGSSDNAGAPLPSLELPAPDPQVTDAFDQPSSDKQPFESQIDNSRLVTAEPSLGGTLTANSRPEGLDPSTDPLSTASTAGQPPLLDHEPGQVAPTEEVSLPEVQPLPDPVAPAPPTPVAPPPAAWTPPATDAFVVHPDASPAPASAPAMTPAPEFTPPPPEQLQQETLSQLEASVNSSHLAQGSDVTAARDQVSEALNGNAAPAPGPQPIQALNAQPLGAELHAPAPPTLPDPQPQPAPFITPDNHTAVTVVSPNVTNVPNPAAPQVTDPTAPPPVPPPIPFQFGTPPQQQ